MKAWKFLVPVDAAHFYRGHVAVAVAETAEDARNRLMAYAIAHDYDVEWLKTAEPVALDVHRPSVLCWAQV